MFFSNTLERSGVFIVKGILAENFALPLNRFNPPLEQAGPGVQLTAFPRASIVHIYSQGPYSHGLMTGGSERCFGSEILAKFIFLGL